MAADKEQKKALQNTVEAKSGKRMIGKNLPFEASESYKLLRTNILFSTAEKGCKVIGVTSPLAGEGKSTTSVNMAYELAESGKKVLLIEGDLRAPAIMKLLKIKKKIGLVHVLAGIHELDSAIAKSVFLEYLDILPAGKIPPNPAEMLASAKMRDVLKELSVNYEYIIIDLPPVMAVSDGLSIAETLTGMVVVVRQGYCDQRVLAETMRQLSYLKIKVLGFVLNRVDEKERYLHRRGGFNRKGKNGYYGSYGNYGVNED